MKIAPTTKAPTITYGLIERNFSSETMRRRTSTITTTGTSNVTPNATNIVSTKDRYLSMSVIIVTPAGAYAAKKWKAIGKTRKYANAMPTRKNAKLETMTGIASRFSC